MTEHPYDSYDHGHAASYKRIHGNGEETHVFVMAQSDDYLAVAMDVDPRSWESVAAEQICYEPTLESAIAKCETWMHDNPKGVLGGESSGGIANRINSIAWTVLKKIDEYGNKQVQQGQEK